MKIIFLIQVLHGQQKFCCNVLFCLVWFRNDKELKIITSLDETDLKGYAEKFALGLGPLDLNRDGYPLCSVNNSKIFIFYSQFYFN